MLSESFTVVGYLIAAILFIFSLGGLSNQKTAKQGNISGIVGMVLAIGITLAAAPNLSYSWAFGALGLGAVVGGTAAYRVAMESMPEMVAILHSFVGLAAVLVGFSTFLGAGGHLSGAEATVHMIEIYLDVAIGALTFTGSVVAWGKLSGNIGSDPLLIPGRHLANLAILIALAAVGYVFVTTGSAGDGTLHLTVNAMVAGVLGIHMVMAIGGADMPVVVSMLNSYSGWAAAAAGFMLSNNLLIITGALVGSSGAILSYIMCKGMNRSFVNVILGGFGTESGGGESESPERSDANAIEPQGVANLLKGAQKVGIVPGYGMAVAQAQHAVSQLTHSLRDEDKEVLIGIHPVAGRMPGHMNVLLAEADIPYDIVVEMDDINAEMDEMDVVLVVGANDIVNPDAETDKSSPIYGMPQIEVWNADTVVILKRSLSTGYAGVQNPLFFRDNARMFFGDAKENLNKLLQVM